ncbi:hypothetical protein B4071_2672 [Bacillus subtilis]|nr:hypothetical protein B4071_2672 [Bacillus subtilis]
MKEVLIRHLEEALDMHEQLSSYMMEKGWYHPWNTDEQVKLHLKNIDTAIQLPTL